MIMRKDKPRRRLRYSLGALVVLVALSAVVCSLLMPLVRPKPGLDKIHSTFQVTAANQAQCASCHAAAMPLPATAGLAQARAPRNPGLGDIGDSAFVQRFFKPLDAQPQPTPICPGASATSSSNRASCVSCHAVKL